MKKYIPLYLALALAPAGASAQIIVNDSFSDGDRGNTGPLQAAWWSSTSAGNNSVEAGVGYLGLATGTSGRGLHGTFAPQTLGVGDTLTATFTFRTPTTVGTTDGGFRFSLGDLNNGGLAADLDTGSSVTQPLFQNLPAYMVDFDVNKADASDDVNVRKHNASDPTGRFMGTTTVWTTINSGPDANYAFTANTEYVAVVSLTRTGADSMDIFGSLSQNNVLLASHTATDASGIANHFGLAGVWVNSNVFGSSSALDTADNGIDFSNIKIEYFAVVPEPSVLALSAAALASLGFFRNRKYGQVSRL